MRTLESVLGTDGAPLAQIGVGEGAGNHSGVSQENESRLETIASRGRQGKVGGVERIERWKRKIGWRSYAKK